jgi:hypothetical protein
MILQKSMLYSYVHPDLNFRFDQHFVSFSQLLYGKWDYWYSMPPGVEDGMSFQLGISQIILAGVGIGYTILNKKRSRAEVYLVIAYLGSLFLMHSKSFFVWEAIPLLKSIQFPWRFLFVPAMLTPLIAFPFLLSLSKKKYFVLVLLMILGLSFANIRNYRRPIKYLDLTEYTDLYRLYYNKTSTTFRTEILPKWNVESERYKSEELLVNAGNMIIDSLTSTPLTVTTTINNKPDESQGRVTILRNYYPGWSVTMDGKKQLDLTPTDDGMMTLLPKIGTHTYEVKMGSTPVEKVANIISFIALLGLGRLWLKRSK